MVILASCSLTLWLGRGEVGGSHRSRPLETQADVFAPDDTGLFLPNGTELWSDSPVNVSPTSDPDLTDVTATPATNAPAVRVPAPDTPVGSSQPVERRIDTPGGPARTFTVGTPERGDVVLGHGAGKGVTTPDLQALLALANDGWRVTLVDQPWVVAGRKVAVAPSKLDEAWAAVLAALRSEINVGQRLLVLGGRSAGARVACRSAIAQQADAVLALAFPLIPAGKREERQKWRTAEAQAVIDAKIPLLVVQPEKDSFAKPDEIAEHLPGARSARAAGTHSFTADPVDVVDAVRAFLRDL